MEGVRSPVAGDRVLISTSSAGPHHECYVCGVKKVVLEDGADLHYPPFLSCDFCGQTFCEDCQSVILCKEKYCGGAGQCFCRTCGETIPTEHREETEPKTPLKKRCVLSFLIP